MGDGSACVIRDDRVVVTRKTLSVFDRLAAITYDAREHLRSREDCLAASSMVAHRDRGEECQGSHEHDRCSAQARRSATMHGAL